MTDATQEGHGRRISRDPEAEEGIEPTYEGIYPPPGPLPPGSNADAREQEERLREIWAAPKGWRYVSAVNNTEVGVWYMAAGFAFFLFAGVLALLIRVQLAVPANDFLSAETYNQVYTLHGSVMMFLFAVPIFEAFAIFILPQMLGARDLPLPRAGAYGFWCYLIGGIFVAGSILFDAAPHGGWFMYPPLTTDTRISGIGADIWLLGLSFIEISSIILAVELVVGTLKGRPPGMRLNLAPLYAWYSLVVAGMILFAFPPLIAGDLLFEMERAFDWPFFDPERGGDPLLWQHLFWIFGHPEVYIIFLPAVALVAMIVPTFAHRPILGYSFIVLAAVGTGFLSFGLWVHHMFATGLPAISLGFFSAASEAVAIPTGVQIFVFIATILVGRVTFGIPMLFVTGALAIFVIGGLTGVMVALAPFDWQAHDTYFVVAHLHYVLIGGMLFPVAAGVYYYFPLVSSRLLNERSGRFAFWTMFLGFNLAFLPMHETGLRGMPRRVFTYPEGLGWDWLNLLSSVGAFVFATGVGIILLDVLRAILFRRDHAARNPWNAGTLEWAAKIPSEKWGVRSVPHIRSRYPLWDQPELVREIDDGRWYIPDAPYGRETIITTVADAVPLQALRVPGPSFLPIAAAIATSAVFIASTWKLWTVVIASGVVALLLIMAWLWTGTARIPREPMRDAGLGLRLPVYMSGPKSVGWWAVLVSMLGISTAYASLVFGYFFYWTVHPVWPPEGATPLLGLAPAWAGVEWPVAAAAAVLGAWFLCALVPRRIMRHGRAATALALLGVALLAAGYCAALWRWLVEVAELDPTAHVYPAAVMVLHLWSGAFALLGIVMALFSAASVLAGRTDARHNADQANTRLYWHFAFGFAAVSLLVTTLFPTLT